MTNHTMWNKTVDILRLATPVLVGVLAYLFLGFQNALEKNTDAVNQFRTELAVMAEKEKNTDGAIQAINSRTDTNTSNISDLKSRMSLVESRLTYQKR